MGVETRQTYVGKWELLASGSPFDGQSGASKTGPSGPWRSDRDRKGAVTKAPTRDTGGSASEIGGATSVGRNIPAEVERMWHNGNTGLANKPVLPSTLLRGFMIRTFARPRGAHSNIIAHLVEVTALLIPELQATSSGRWLT